MSREIPILPVLAQQIHVETLGFLFGGSVNDQLLADSKTVGNATLKRNRVVLASPADMVQVQVTVHGKVGDRRER